MNRTRAIGAFIVALLLVVADAVNPSIRGLASEMDLKPKTSALEELPLFVHAHVPTAEIINVQGHAIFRNKTDKHDHRLERLLQGDSPVEYTTCPASRAQCTFSHDDLTPGELEIYSKLGTTQAWEDLFSDAQTAQLVFDWMKVSLKGLGPNSCVPPAITLTNALVFGVPLDVLNPLFYIEILVAGPCETFKPRVETLYSRLKNLYKAANNLAKVPKIGPFFSKVAKFLKRPVDALDEVRHAMKDGCKAVSSTRKAARYTLEILNHVGTACGVLGSLMDYYLISICNQANENAANARLRASGFPNSRRYRGLQANEVDVQLQKQAEIIRTRTMVPKAVYDNLKDFDETVAPVLNKLKATWDRVEQELENMFDGIEDVVELFAPFQEVIDILGAVNCADIPVVSYGKQPGIASKSFSAHLEEWISNFSTFYFDQTQRAKPLI